MRLKRALLTAAILGAYELAQAGARAIVQVWYDERKRRAKARDKRRAERRDACKREIVAEVNLQLLARRLAALEAAAGADAAPVVVDDDEADE